MMVCHIISYNSSIVISFDDVVAILSFNQTMYSIDEDATIVQPTLVLSKPLYTNITVEVISNDINATGKFLCKYNTQL